MPNNIRTFATIMNSSNNLLKSPSIRNTVTVNFWQAGYYIPQNTKNDEGLEITEKIFKATTSLEAAIVFLKDYYGNSEYLKFKSDTSPGHVSLLTRSSYLSVGPYVEALSDVGLNSTHKMHYIRNFREDCLISKRLPEKMISLHTLNCAKIEEVTKNFPLIEQVSYTLLGNRNPLKKTETAKEQGHSCATAVHTALVEGGLNELLRADQKIISEKMILTPASIMSYVERAKDYEVKLFPESARISEQFNTSRQQYLSRIKRATISSQENERVDAFEEQRTINKLLKR